MSKMAGNETRQTRISDRKIPRVFGVENGPRLESLFTDAFVSAHADLKPAIAYQLA
jgi:hypothetical protein